MKQLRLKFKDETGKTKIVSVKGEKFFVGRTPDNNLGVAIPTLSRKHLQIDRFGDVFIVSDCNSGNGTVINGSPLTEPSELKSGDKLNLGGNFEIEAEIISDEPASDLPIENPPEASGAKKPDTSVSQIQTSSENSFSFGFLLLAPLLGIFVLAVIGGIIYSSSRKVEISSVGNNDYKPSASAESNDNKDIEDNNKDDYKAAPDSSKNTPTPSKTSEPLNAPSPSQETSNTTETLPAPKLSGDRDKIERASIAFLRRMAANDPNAFLTDKQIFAVSPAVNQFKNSSALAANLKNAKADLSKIKDLANSKNLRPQFVTAAALAKIGNRSGNVLQTAQSMIETLSTLRTAIGNEFADDNLLIIAAYDQGEAGQTLAMRDTVANLTNKFPDVSSRTVRTIWFLRENGKLSDAEFDFALKFLALGIIMQNPKDFNVESEAIKFD